MLEKKIDHLSEIQQSHILLQADHAALAERLTHAHDVLASTRDELVTSQKNLHDTKNDLEISTRTINDRDSHVASLEGQIINVTEIHRNLITQHESTIDRLESAIEGEKTGRMAASRNLRSIRDDLERSHTAHLKTIKHYAFDHFIINLKGVSDVSEVLAIEARYLGRKLARFQSHGRIYDYVLAGAMFSAQSDLPGCTILPLIHMLEHMAATTWDNGLSPAQWNSIRQKAIAKFQSTFIDDVGHSLRKLDSQLKTKTILLRIVELIVPLVGMKDFAVVLEPPLGAMMTIIFGNEGSVFEGLDRAKLASEINSMTDSHCRIRTRLIR